MAEVCPSREALQDLLAQPSAQTEVVRRHADGCEACTRALQALTLPGSQQHTRSSAGPSSTARAFLPRGTTLAHYVLLEPLGAGGMGSVYAAYDAKLDRRIAIKLLHDDLAADPERAERLEREAKAMAKISHPNVLAVHELGNHDGRRFIAMELVQGWTLGDWLTLKPRSWKEILAQFRAAGAGLAAAHRAHLVHRDFKPSNVLVREDGRAQVTDFGLVRLHSEASLAPLMGLDTPVISDSALTLAGTLLGTPRYMSPEQLSGNEATERSDQYSFCVALYEALYGAHPFRTDSLAALLQDMPRGLPAKLPRSEVPRFVSAALQRGLSFSAQERWPSMDALLAELSRELAPRRQRWVSAISVGAAALLVSSGFALVQQRKNAECAEAANAFDSAWSAPQRERMKAAFEKVAAPVALEGLARASGRLDEYRDEWRQARTEVCTARRGGELSAEIGRRKEDCLEVRRREVAALTKTFGEADDRIASRATSATYALTPVSSCLDAAALALRPDVEGEDLARAGELVGRLGEIKTGVSLGSGMERTEELRAIAQEAKALGNRAIEADALALLGNVLSNAGQPQEADAVFKEGILAATASRHHTTLARLWMFLAQSKAVDQGKFEEAYEALGFAEAALEASGNPELTRLHTLVIRSLVLWSARRIPEALESARAAVELGETLPESRHELYIFRVNLGGLLSEVGKLEEAGAQLEKAIGDVNDLLGASHPRNIEAYMNLSLVYRGQTQRPDHLQAAEKAARNALVVAQRAFGEENLRTADPMMNLGELLNDARRWKESEALLAGSIARYRQSGIEHRVLMNALIEHSTALLRLGQREAARKELQAVDALRPKVGDDPKDPAVIASAWADYEMTSGNPGGAVRQLETAIKIFEGVTDHASVLADARFAWARAKFAADRRAKAAAIASATRAKQVFEADGRTEDAQEAAAFIALASAAK